MKAIAIASTIVLGLTAMPPQTATAIVSGVVVTGAPPIAVPFADVRLADEFNSGRSHRAVTDEDGRFIFKDVRESSYVLAAFKPGFAPGYYDGSGTPSNEQVAAVRVGDGARIDDLIVPIVRGASVSGTVTDPFGDPVRAQVAVRPTRPPATRARPIDVPYVYDMYRTKPGGTFRVYGLPAGDYIVSATGEEQSYGRLGTPTGPMVAFATVFYNNTPNPMRATVVSLGPGEEKTGVDIVLQMVNLVSVTGAVTMPPNVNSSSVLVRMRPVRSDLVTGNYISVAKRADGTFSATNIRPGEYFVGASGRGTPIGTTTPTAALAYWGSTQVTVADRDISGLLVTLAPTVPVSGRIVTAAETGVETSQMFVSLEWQAAPNADGDGTSPQARANANGTFTIANVIPGRYRLAARSSVTGTSARIVSVRGTGVSGEGPEIDVANAPIGDLVVTIAAAKIR